MVLLFQEEFLEIWESHSVTCEESRIFKQGQARLLNPYEGSIMKGLGYEIIFAASISETYKHNLANNNLLTIKFEAKSTPSYKNNV